MRRRKRINRRRYTVPAGRPRTSDLRTGVRVYKERRYHERRKTEKI